MNGSEKQIKWANEIKSRINADFDKLNADQRNHPAVSAAINLINSIQDAKIWIEEFNSCSGSGLLFQMARKEGLKVKDDNMFDYAVVSEDGKITWRSK